MTRIGIVGHGKTMEFDAEDMAAIAKAAAAFGISAQALMNEIEKVMQANRVNSELEKLAVTMEEAAMLTKELDYAFVNTQKERVYCSYKSKLLPPDKRRCFRPKIYWNRTRSNPR